MSKTVKTILALKAEGLSTAEVARRVNLNPTTVRYHLAKNALQVVKTTKKPKSKNPFGTGEPCVICGKREGNRINCGACNSPRCILARMTEVL